MHKLYIHIKAPNRLAIDMVRIHPQWVELCRLNKALFKDNKAGEIKTAGQAGGAAEEPDWLAETVVPAEGAAGWRTSALSPPPAEGALPRASLLEARSA